MAVISEEYVLADRFSGTFNKLLSFFRQSATAGAAAAASQQQLQEASGRLGGALDKMAEAALEASSALDEMSVGVEEASESTDQAVRSQDRMNRSMREGDSAASGLMRRVMSLAGAYASLRTAQKFVELSDTYVQTTARLDRMNDGLQSTAELQDMIYQAAMRARGAYQETADMVGKLGTLAPDAFGSSEELVAFVEQINKQFTLAGTSTQGAQAAMLQLTQAMSSGVLRGEELNSVLEQAPTIAQAIARYMGVSLGEMRELASEGKITAGVVKAALFSAAEETNAAFEKVPMTFGQAWTMAKNAAMRALEPAMQQLNDFLNSDLGQKMLSGLVAGFEMLGNAASWAVDLLVSGAQWVADNWDFVSTVLQFAGGALLALAAVSVASALKSAGAWAMAHLPLLLLITVVGFLIAAVYAAGNTSEEVFSKIGAIAGGLYAFVYNLVATIWNFLASFAEFFANMLNGPTAAIVSLLAGLADFALSVIQNIAGAIDAVFGSNLVSAAKGWAIDKRNAVQVWADNVIGEKRIKIERMALLDNKDISQQWAATAGKAGKALDNFSPDDFTQKFSGGGFDYSAMLGDIPDALGGIKSDTGAIKRSVALSEEDVKLLVDMAEHRYVNNINLTAQTPVINVNGQDTGDSEVDAIWLADTLQRMLIEQAASHTDLSYAR